MSKILKYDEGQIQNIISEILMAIPSVISRAKQVATTKVPDSVLSPILQGIEQKAKKLS